MAFSIKKIDRNSCFLSKNGHKLPKYDFFRFSKPKTHSFLNSSGTAYSKWKYNAAFVSMSNGIRWRFGRRIRKYLQTERNGEKLKGMSVCLVVQIRVVRNPDSEIPEFRVFSAFRFRIPDFENLIPEIEICHSVQHVCVSGYPYVCTENFICTSNRLCKKKLGVCAVIRLSGCPELEI